MRKVLFEVALRLSKVVAIMIGTRSIDVEAAADLGAQRAVLSVLPIYHSCLHNSIEN